VTLPSGRNSPNHWFVSETCYIGFKLCGRGHYTADCTGWDAQSSVSSSGCSAETVAVLWLEMDSRRSVVRMLNSGVCIDCAAKESSGTGKDGTSEEAS